MGDELRFLTRYLIFSFGAASVTLLPVAIELTIEDWRQRSWVAKGTELLLSPWRPLF